MNKTNVRRAPLQGGTKAQQSPFSLDAARIAYISSSSRVDLAKLAKLFDTAPDEVEVSGRQPLRKSANPT